MRPVLHGAWIAGVTAALLALGGCGGGGGGGGGGTAAPPQNTQLVVVDPGPANTVNLLFTSVTLCTPGDTGRCQTIDHILVDTGSTGLRIISSLLNATLASLPAQTDATGNAIVECVQFLDGFSWGPVKLADVWVAGEKASSVPIQVIGDPAYPAIPSACANTGPPENTVADFGANGVIGLGVFLQDCGLACATSASVGLYYVCPTSSTCRAATVPTSKQVQNPAAMFPSDNNGVIIDLPAISASGAATATGSLIFGVGTQSNNGLGAATVVPVDPDTGNVVTVYNGRTYADSFFDSGSSVLFFGTTAFPVCRGVAAGLYCPASTQTLSAIVRGTNNVSSTVTFSVANADALFAANPLFTAFGNLAAPNPYSTGFDWGLPFHFGRRVYTVFEGRTSPGGAGPYVAY
jgi:hypothetical protein